MAVVTRDLMDGGRFRAIAPGVVVVRDPDPSALKDALCIIVDLAGGFDLGALVAIGPPVIAYGAHVDTDALDAAKRAGCHDAIPRSRIVRRVGELAAGDPLV